MLILISDLHLSDGTAVHLNTSAKQAEDFWHNINRTQKRLLRRAKGPEIELVILGDFLDIIRSNEWSDPANKGVKPWSTPGPEQKRVLEKIIARIFKHNEEILDTFRKFAKSKTVRVNYMIGNHDHHLLHYPDLFKKIHDQLGFDYPDDPNTLQFYERFWPEYGVLAHHGDKGDPWNDTRGLLHPIGDALVTEIYNRFPARADQTLSGNERLKHELENLVFVRPYRLSPVWISQVSRQYGEEDKIKRVWNDLVEEFMVLDFVQMWIRETKKMGKFINPAVAFRATLAMSKRLEFRGWLSLSRLGNLGRTILSVDPPGVRNARKQLQQVEDPRIRYLVNGHTHNPGVISVGRGKGTRLAYVNTGTWTRTLLPERLGQLEPADHPMMGFTPGDFVCYAAFYRPDEEPARDMEFWSGRIMPRAI